MEASQQHEAVCTPIRSSDFKAEPKSPPIKLSPGSSMKALQQHGALPKREEYQCFDVPGLASKAQFEACLATLDTAFWDSFPRNMFTTPWVEVHDFLEEDLVHDGKDPQRHPQTLAKSEEIFSGHLANAKANSNCLDIF